MVKYKNKSKFYKMITLNGKRANIPPNGIFVSSNELDLNIYDFLEVVGNDVKETINFDDQKSNKKIEIVDHKKYEKLEKAIIMLSEKINTKDNIQDMIDESIKNLTVKSSQEQNIIENEKLETIERRLEILKKVNDELINAVNMLEVFVYEKTDDLPIVVVEDEPSNETGKNKNRSIEDILRGG